MSHARIVPFVALVALKGFINPPMSRFTYHIETSLQLVWPLTGAHFFLAARRGQSLHHMSFGSQ